MIHANLLTPSRNQPERGVRRLITRVSVNTAYARIFEQERSTRRVLLRRWREYCHWQLYPVRCRPRRDSHALQRQGNPDTSTMRDQNKGEILHAKRRDCKQSARRYITAHHTERVKVKVHDMTKSDDIEQIPRENKTSPAKLNRPTQPTTDRPRQTNTRRDGELTCEHLLRHEKDATQGSALSRVFPPLPTNSPRRGKAISRFGS